MKPHYKTIILSDIHLGIRNSRVKEAVEFLNAHKCDTLILNGDIIDGWQLKKIRRVEKETHFFLPYHHEVYAQVQHKGDLPAWQS